jgi:hypothetical protein
VRVAALNDIEGNLSDPEEMTTHFEARSGA